MKLTAKMRSSKDSGFIDSSDSHALLCKTIKIMKLSAVLLLLSFQIYAGTYSQNVSLSEKNVKLTKVLDAIEKKTGLYFWYDQLLLDKTEPVTISCHNLPWNEVLSSILHPQGLNFNMENGTIVITRKPLTMPDSLTIAMPIPPLKITGVVKDPDGNPLQGASVRIKGASSGVVSNAYGIFKISANEGEVLEITVIGYKPFTTVIHSNNNDLIVVMQTDVANLNDIVVVGYGTQKKTNVIGSITTVKMDDVLGDRPVTEVSNLLQGAAPGLLVTINSGQPGAPQSSTTNLNIRGGTDFTGNTLNNSSPFIVMDNIPFNGSLSLIDPSDIESVTVLKDAGSAAIYGARSAFGVILITTKKGHKNQKAQFSYSNNFVTSTVAELPQKATPTQFIQQYIDGGNLTYQGQSTSIWQTQLAAYQTNPKSYPGGYTIQNGVYMQLAPTDALKQFLGSSANQQMHNFSVSGGNDKTTYRLSFGTSTENGIIVPEAHQDYFNRYNLKSIITTDVNPWLNLQVDAGFNSSTGAQPFYQVGIASDAFQQISNITPLVPLDTVPGIGVVSSPKYWVMNTAPINTTSNESRITGRAVLKPVRGLTITGEYTIDRFNTLVNTYDKYATGVTYTGAATSVGTSGGVYTKQNGLTNYNAINLFGTYNRSFGLHNTTLMIGFNQEQSHAESTTASRGQLINPSIPSLNTAVSTTPTASDSYTDYANIGYFGRLNYDYKNKYLFQVNGRFDGSSKFPDGHRWGFFPSASAGWRVMEENFTKMLKPYLNEFKIRGSWGNVGNQNISAYSYNGIMSPSVPYWLNNGTQVETVNQPTQIISPNYTWETVSTLDFGADWGIIKNHLTGSFDWYKRDTKGILTNNAVQLPVTLGTGAPLVNAGSLESKGVEIQLNWKDKIGKVNYYFGINLSDYQTVVTNVPNATNVLSSLYTGQKMGNIWGFVTDRLYTVNDFVAGSLDANLKNGVLLPGIPKTYNTSNSSIQAPNPGDILYKDLDKNDTINIGQNTLTNHGDKKIIGNSTPRYQFGINGGVSYKNFDFSFVLVGVGKQDQWIANDMTFPNYWAGQSTLYSNELNYWTPTQTNAYYGRIYTTTGVPVGTGVPAANQDVQTRFLLNGAYLRVKNLTLRYNFPEKVLKASHLTKLQLFFTMEDPFIFDHMPKGVYPDVVRSGSGSGGGQGYPFMKKNSVGLNLSF